MKCGGLSRLGLLSLAAWFWVSLACAEPPIVVVPGESRATALRLDEARKHLADRKWADALEELQSLLDSGGNDLVAVDAGRSVRARWLIHAEIAALPPEARRLYRSRVDRQAARWLEQAAASHDTRLLQKIVEDAFCSTPAEKALDLLGDLAFERGRFEEALAWWQRLVPAEPVPAAAVAPGECVYPDLQTSPARIRAKQLLARLFAHGQSLEWDDDLKRYRAANGTASGSLAGSTGRYADILAEIARQGDEGLRDPDWSSFGGDGSRSLVPPAGDALEELGKLMQEGPACRISLNPRDRVAAPPDPGKPLSPSALNRAMVFHPVITRTHVVVANGGRITAVDLRTRRSRIWYDAGRFEDVQPPKFGEPAGVRWTLTTSAGRLYARLGVRGIHPVERADAGVGGRPAEPLRTLLRSLQMPAADSLDEGATPRWLLRLTGGAATREPAFFEGTPLAFRNQVFVAVSRFVGQRLVTSIHCYTDEAEPAHRWRCDVCETAETRPDEPRFQHHLLTQAGNLLVYCSHTGAIVAVDALTGQPAWAVRYPRHEEEPDDEILEPVPTKGQIARARDLAPCLFADARLYAAPADSDRLLCLDPASGRTLWERERLHVVHLLGVGQGRLIFTTTSGLRAVGAADGTDAAGWMLPDTGRLPPMGRGLLLGDLVLWPTVRWRAGGAPGFMVYAIRQADGRPAADPTFLHRLPAGNLAYAHGCLAVADRDSLSIFVPPRMLLEERRRAVDEQPDGPAAWLGLGRAEADAHHPAAAAAAFRRAEKLTASGDGLATRRLLEAARRGLQAALLAEGRAALSSDAADRIALAEGAFRAAVAVDTAPPGKLHALLQAATLWKDEQEAARAEACWEEVFRSASLRDLPLCEKGLPVKAGTIAAEAARKLARTAGNAFLEATNAQARALWEAAPPKARSEAAQRLVQEFPHAPFTLQVLRELTREPARLKHPGMAAWAWRQLESLDALRNQDGPLEAALARCLEQEGLPEAAELQWRLLAALHPGTADEEAIYRLQEQIAQPAPSFPWRRAWHAALGPEETFLPGCDPEDCPSVVFTAAGRTVAARRLASGAVAWRQELRITPTWASLWSDMAVVAGADGVVGLRLEDGMPVWDFPLPVQGLRQGGTGVTLDPEYPERLGGFQLPSSTLFFFQGQRRLFAVDTKSGKCRWARWAPGAALSHDPEDGHFHPLYHAGPREVLLQTSAKKWWLLNAATGEIVREGPASPQPWPLAPIVLDGPTLCFVPAPREVRALDPVTGLDRWTHHTSGRTLASGEPCHLIGDGEELLVVTPWNTGYYLNRLDPATGRPQWKRSCFLSLRDLNRQGWAVDREAIYQAQEGVLAARSLEDGHLLWERPLPPGSGWALRRIGERLVAHPTVVSRTYFRFPSLGAAVQYLGAELSPALTEFPVLVCDPRTGDLMERLNFPPPRSVRWTVEPFAGRSAPGEQRLPRAVLYTGPGKCLVALGSGLWGLTADE
jgi:outer membrane protein assembly factor BamB